MRAGSRRRELDATLRAAYGEGLLSDNTFIERLGQLMTTGSVSPKQLVGDLTLRSPTALTRVTDEISRHLSALARSRREQDETPLLALDWQGSEESFSIGRADGCDLRLEETTVSRRHARLFFRDGAWIVQDLGSRNGTSLNGRRVVRARVRPGDALAFAERTFRID